MARQRRTLFSASLSVGAASCRLGAKSWMRRRSRRWRLSFIVWVAESERRTLHSRRRRGWTSLRRFEEGLSAERQRRLSPHQMDIAVRDARHLLHLAVPPLGPRIQRAASGGARRLGASTLLFLLYRDLAARDLLPHRPPDHRGDDAVPHERARGPRLVRLSLPADSLVGPVLSGRAPY